ncbi:MAG: adenylate/guanylate cyclase domain-containing protein, partial [Pseudomonadota bacterium]
KAEVRVAAERKRLTVFFSDLVSFTEITDRLEPEEITALLNDYLTEMSAIARAHGACFDKFMGDGMLFYFGDPETKGAKEDASACVRMGIAMQRRLRELNTVWAEQGMERPLRLRIGIHTGFCTVGNFGSAERMDYTIIGGTVNLAARLEFHCEPGGILMSHTTHALVSDWVAADEAEPISVRGFARPISTHRVMGIYEGICDDEQVMRHSAPGVSLALAVNKKRLGASEREATLSQLRAARETLDRAIDEI